MLGVQRMDHLEKNPEYVREIFKEERLPPYYIHSQRSELVHIIQIIGEYAKHKQRPLHILDIGVGDGRVLKELVQLPPIWNAIAEYTGIDISSERIDEFRRLTYELGVDAKVRSLVCNAKDLSAFDGETFDLVVCTWFTAGNFQPASAPAPGETLDFNESFYHVIREAYGKLSEGKSEVILGSVYHHRDEAFRIQKECYESYGWKVLSTKEDRFMVADTGEGQWWSERLNLQMIYHYLSGGPELPMIHVDSIECFDLDPYNFAMMVRLRKLK